jgi:uncharacterized protein (DUF885 family)
MTDQQAMDLMINQTYQEKEEAVGKWQRAQLSSAQLPMYFLGYSDWLEVRARNAQEPLAQFNDRALKEGAVRMPSLAGLLGAKAQ